jgi:hypothetical protein
VKQEDLLRIWFDTKPTGQSPYGINGHCPMWETLKDGDLTLFTAPAKVMHRFDQWSPHKEIDGLQYQWQRDGKWVGQGCQTTFEHFTANGPSKIEIPPAPEAKPAPRPKRLSSGRYSLSEGEFTVDISYRGDLKGWIAAASWDQHLHTDPVSTYRAAVSSAGQMLKDVAKGLEREPSAFRP